MALTENSDLLEMFIFNTRDTSRFLVVQSIHTYPWQIIKCSMLICHITYYLLLKNKVTVRMKVNALLTS